MAVNKCESEERLYERSREIYGDTKEAYVNLLVKAIRAKTKCDKFWGLFSLSCLTGLTTQTRIDRERSARDSIQRASLVMDGSLENYLACLKLSRE